MGSSKAPSEIEYPSLPLRFATVDEYCRALLEARSASFWWYQGKSRIFGNYSLPFQDTRGRWWYQVKPGMCWPADFLTPIDPATVDLPLQKRFLAYQHITDNSENANSKLVINVINDLSQYGVTSIDAKRRNAIRKGSQLCGVRLMEHSDSNLFEECRETWNDLSTRTGWKESLERKAFHESWSMLLDLPGTTIMVGFDKESGRVAGFLIAKVLGDTAYVDTIASRSSLLRTNVNDVLLYSFIKSAQKVPGVRKVHYAIKSYIESLEWFKASFGFDPYPFPAYSWFLPFAEGFLKIFRRAEYNRLVGNFDDSS